MQSRALLRLKEFMSEGMKELRSEGGKELRNEGL